MLNDRAVNPMKHLTATRTQLRGLDLERFRKIVAANLAEAEREGKPR